MHDERALTVGISVSLTGQYARQGNEAFCGATLWAEQYGAQLFHYDDESRPDRAADNARRLLERDGVSILFGPYSSGLARRIAAVAERHGRVMWNHGGSADDIAGPFVVSTPAPASRYFRGLPTWLLGNAPGARVITILQSPRGSFAALVARGLREEAERCGFSVKILALGAALPPESQVLVLAASFEPELEVIRARPNARILCSVAAGLRSFGDELGPLAEGIIGPSQWEPDPRSERFVRSFQQRFGRPPEYVAASAYAMGLVLQECIRRSGAGDDRRLRQTAAELDFETFFGRFRIEPESGRQLGHDITLIRWEHLQKVPLR